MLVKLNAFDFIETKVVIFFLFKFVVFWRRGLEFFTAASRERILEQQHHTVVRDDFL